MKKIILLLFIISFNTKAQDKTVQVYIVDKDIDEKILGDSYEVTRVPDNGNSLPAKELRDNLLQSVEKTKNWDELKKDIFYMDLKNKDLKYLINKYPEISAEQLKVLQGKL